VCLCVTDQVGFLCESYHREQQHVFCIIWGSRFIYQRETSPWSFLNFFGSCYAGHALLQAISNVSLITIVDLVDLDQMADQQKFIILISLLYWKVFLRKTGVHSRYLNSWQNVWTFVHYMQKLFCKSSRKISIGDNSILAFRQQCLAAFVASHKVIPMYMCIFLIYHCLMNSVHNQALPISLL